MVGLFKPNVKKLAEKKDINGLIKALKHKSGTRRLAAEALGRTGNAQAVEPLIELLKDESKAARLSAAELRGSIVSHMKCRKLRVGRALARQLPMSA